MQSLFNKLAKLYPYLVSKYRSYYFPPFEIRNEGCYTLDLNTPDNVSRYISELLEGETPCMISRYGANELLCALFYMNGNHPLFFLRRIYPFWVPLYQKESMLQNAGFFPLLDESFCEFSDLIFNASKEVDLLGSWIKSESLLEPQMEHERCPLLFLEPFRSTTPWSKSLKGKKVLVVHPFAETIIEQYQKRELLFENPDVLPEFGSLTVIKAIQSIGGDTNGFKSWFDALHFMENQIDSVDYDIALIGCGAYGMPLAAHCKKLGKKAVHLGGGASAIIWN